MNNISEIRELIASFRRDNTLPYRENLMYITYGPKTTNGVETGEYGLIFHVKEKLPIDALQIERVIPASITFEDISIITDVEAGIVYNHTIGDCHVRDDFVEPVRSTRIRQRTIRGGSSSIAKVENGYVATMGLLVRDKSDGQVVALSNNHVFAGSSLHPAYTSTYSNVHSLCAIQPAYESYGSADRASDVIGTCKKFVPVGDEMFTTIGGYVGGTTSDSAILALSTYNVIDSNSAKIVGFDPLPPYQFATDVEIDSLLDTSSVNYAAPLFRSGRTCGPVGYPGNTYSCQISCYQFGDAIVGAYSGKTSYFLDSFWFRGRGDIAAGRGGDSGSAVLALLSSTMPAASAWKVIGLLFAGPGSSTYSIGCRITSIVQKLDIAPWNTLMPTVSATYKTMVIAPLNYTTLQDSCYITLSGRKYFYVGK
jgi:hypothetical protein